MTDWLTREQRSRNMASIRSKGNKTTEERFVTLLRASRISGWRRHADLTGKPDFVFREKRLAIFVDGCFWHGCPQCGHIPKTHKAYWKTKIARNKARDAMIARLLKKAGFKVIRLWECDLKSRPEICIRRIRRALQKAAT